jgi:hypothetical protein
VRFKDVDWFWVWILLYSLYQVVDLSIDITSDKGVNVQVQTKKEEPKTMTNDDGPKADWK